MDWTTETMIIQKGKVEELFFDAVVSNVDTICLTQEGDIRHSDSGRNLTHSIAESAFVYYRSERE